jgi:hypothetical protein
MSTNVAAPAAPVATPTAPAAPAPAAKTKADPEKAARAQAEPKASAGEPQVKKVRVTAHERAVKIKADLEKADPPEPKSADEGAPSAAKTESSSADSEPEEKPKKEAKPPEKDEAAGAAETRRKERQQRLREAQDRERKADEERRAKSRDKDGNAEVEKLRKRLAELEPLEGVFASEEALLEAAEKRNMSTEKLVAWMRTRLTDPQAVAQRQAQTVEQKFEAKLAEERKAREELERKLAARDAEAAETRAATERAHNFKEMVASKEQSHPLTASLMKRRGVEKLVQFANEQVVQYLPENYGLDHLHDVIEEYLEFLSGGDSPSPANQQAATSQPPKRNGAEKPVTTLSNALGSERASVTEEVPLHRLSLDERAQRLKESLGNG